MSRGRQGVAEERRQSLGTMAELPRESSSCEGRTVIEEDQFQERDVAEGFHRVRLSVTPPCTRVTPVTTLHAAIQPDFFP